MNHAMTMTWADFYLICFAIGFCLSFFSFVFGGARTGRLHLPHAHTGGHLPSVARGPLAAGHGASASAASHSAQTGSVSPFNFVTLTAFLAWFGGTGFLLTRYSALSLGLGLLVSTSIGLVGGAIVFLFLTRVLMSDQEYMDPADYEMVGVLGRVSSSIREGGTGEMIYTQMGTRRVCGARSDDGSGISKGTEVVVTRYEKGLAYVRLWSEMSGELEQSPASAMSDSPIGNEERKQ
jgi:membrane protein implicated in regulation of membrane protease activity